MHTCFRTHLVLPVYYYAVFGFTAVSGSAVGESVNRGADMLVHYVTRCVRCSFIVCVLAVALLEKRLLKDLLALLCSRWMG